MKTRSPFVALGVIACLAMLGGQASRADAASGDVITAHTSIRYDLGRGMNRGSVVLADLRGSRSLEIVIQNGPELTILGSDGFALSGFPLRMSSGVSFADIRGSATVADIDRDGRLDVIASDLTGVHVFSAWGIRVAHWRHPRGGPAATAPVVVRSGRWDHPVIFSGSTDGKVYAFKHVGRALPGWPVDTAAAISGGLAAGDMDGDGKPEIVATTEDGRIHAWHIDGARVEGFPVGSAYGYATPPVLADVDGDGDVEVVAGGMDYMIHVYAGDGARVSGFPYKTGFRILAAPAVADMDGDGAAEIIVASGDGAVHVVRGDGTTMRGFPFPIGGVPRGAPVIGDVDGDGAFEIVVVDGVRGVHIIGSNGERLGFASVGACVASPYLADADRDGRLEIYTVARSGLLTGLELALVDGLYSGKSRAVWPGMGGPTRHGTLLAGTPGAVTRTPEPAGPGAESGDVPPPPTGGELPSRRGRLGLLDDGP